MSGFDWTSLLPLAGGLLGAAGSQDQQQTQSKTPWGEAVPWMRQNMQTGQDLQRKYQQDPFNQQQKTGYQNLYNTLDTQRQTNGNMTDFANRMATSQYQRANRAGDGVGPTMPAQTSNQGSAPFVRDNASQGYGLIDWDAQNPYKNGTIKAQPTQQEQIRGLLDAYAGEAGTGGEGGQSGNGQSGTTGIGVGNMSSARDSAALSGLLGALGLSPGLMGLAMGIGKAGNVTSQTNQAVLDAINRSNDPIAALAAIQGWGDLDQGYLGGIYGGGDYGGYNGPGTGNGNDFGGGRTDPTDRD